MERETIKRIGLFLGPAAAAVCYTLLPLATGLDTGGLTSAGKATAAMAVWMACWWLTEAVPLAATALLPIVFLPLTDALPIKNAAAPYASSLIFLFMGGFLIGLAIQRFGLHQRIALYVLLRIGTSPRRLVAGFMLASAGLSMWISNTATAIMMLPIAASLLTMVNEQEGPEDHAKADCRTGDAQTLGTALVLGIAYACSIGGMATLVGTPPNLVLAAFVKNHYGTDVSMARWLGVGLPLVIVLLPLTWWYLTRLAFPLVSGKLPCGRDVILSRLRSLGPMSSGERRVLVVFGLTATAWIFRPQLAEWSGLNGLDDAVIGMLGALILFVLPVDWKARQFAMDWDTAKQLPWDILILFGGGLSLAAALAQNGVDQFIASGFVELRGAPTWVVLLAVTAVVVFLTEITSNTAVTTTLLPVLAATAVATGTPPGMLLTAATLAASCAFMLPVATPPNAIVFASGQVTIPQMAKAGIWLNVMAVGVITLLVYLGAELPVAS